MNKIFFFIPFLILGCSTPEIYIPSYNFGSDNTVNNILANKREESITSVVNIQNDDNKDIISSNIILNTKQKKENIKKKLKKTKIKIHKSSNFFSSLLKPKVKKEYFTGGKIRSKLVMSDDTGESGLLYKYGYDGEITSTIHIKHGIKHGLETLFDKKGRIVKRTPYINGRKDGIVEVYYPDGKVLAQITYANNKRHGRASKYNHDGTTNEEVYYEHGRVSRTEDDDIEIPMID